MTDDEKRLLAELLSARIEILPDAKTRGAEWHVCTPEIKPSGLIGRCVKCKCPVYYAEEVVGAKKICVPCAKPMMEDKNARLVVGAGHLLRAAIKANSTGN